VTHTLHTWFSIDGGNEAKTGRACYAAEWLGTELVHVAACTIADACGNGDAVELVVVERHQQDKRLAGATRNGRRVGYVPPGVIIDLAWNTAAVAYTLAAGAPVVEYTPATWIGSTPKCALQARIWAALTPDERLAVAWFRPGAGVKAVSAALRAATLAHIRGTTKKHHWFNAIDAVGIGLYHLGRVGKGAAHPSGLKGKP